VRGCVAFLFFHNRDPLKNEEEVLGPVIVMSSSRSAPLVARSKKFALGPLGHFCSFHICDVYICDVQERREIAAAFEVAIPAYCRYALELFLKRCVLVQLNKDIADTLHKPSRLFCVLLVFVHAPL
jgi:hypothetical protein